jgi:hypothetical protein
MQNQIFYTDQGQDGGDHMNQPDENKTFDLQLV